MIGTGTHVPDPGCGETQEADAFKTAPYNGNRSALAARLDDDYLASIVPGFFQRAFPIHMSPKT